jgi:hypothetical protein
MFGDETFRKLLNPQPPEAYSNYVVRGWLVDGALTIFTSSKMGVYAIHSARFYWHINPVSL